MEGTVYNPPPSLAPFLTSDAYVSLVSGPVGSGKSSAALLKIAYHAKQMRKQSDGTRRSRAVVIRNTRSMLLDATIPSFNTWFPEGIAGDYKRTELKFMLKFDDVECEVLFRGLDDANDVRRLLSLEVSFGVLDEYREIHPDIFNALQGRVGRFPSMKDGGCVKDDGTPNVHIWGATNAPDSDSWWETYMSDPPSTAKVFMQPSALSPEADWLEHLIPGYYENLAEGKTEDWVAVYIHNEFGRSLQGQPVFRCFDKDTHVAKSDINVGDGPLIIGVDAGLNPTAVITQQTYDGRIVVLDALTGAEGGMGALRFIRERLKPLLLNKYSGKTHHLVIDPAASQRAQTDERSVADIFKTEGFSVKPAKTNSIAARIAAVESYLTRTVNGNAGMLIDPECKELIVALRSKYRYRINAKGETDDKPEKSHPASDYCFVAGTLIKTLQGSTPIEDLRAGDTVLTPSGSQRVVGSACTSTHAEVWEWVFSDGTAFTATPNHPVYVENAGGFIPLCDVSESDILLSISVSRSATWLKTASSGSMEKGSRVMLRIATFGTKVASQVSASLRQCTGIFGHFSTETYPMGWLSTTRMGTPATTPLATLRYNSGAPTSRTMLGNDLRRGGTQNRRSNSHESQPQSGMGRLKVSRGMLSMENVAGTIGGRCLRLVAIAVKAMNTCSGHVSLLAGTALQSAKVRLGGHEAMTMSDARVVFAAPNLFATSTQKQKHVVNLAGKRRCPEARPVYALRVENEPMYYAAGVLVKNCDALQYACLHHDNGGLFGATLNASTKREIKRASATGWT